ncbi:MAG: hypothetical protein U1F67_22780 [Rubrivivax sp.]
MLYATGAKEAAFDGEGRNGPLTRHVLEHIGTRGMPVEEFIKRVTAGVEAETLRDYRKRQTPYISACSPAASALPAARAKPRRRRRSGSSTGRCSARRAALRPSERHASTPSVEALRRVDAVLAPIGPGNARP